MIFSFRVIQLNYDLNKLCILLLPQIHMFLTGIYFFKFKHIFKHARKFGEPSFYFMLIRNILESALFAVFRLDTNCRYLKLLCFFQVQTTFIVAVIKLLSSCD